MDWLPPVKGFKKNKKAHQLFLALKDSILSGKMQTGEKLPSTREIAKYYSIDKSTVLEAIKLLKNYGLVETIPGSAVFISPIFPSIPFTSSMENIEKAEQRVEISKDENLKFYFLMPEENIFPYDFLKKELEKVIEEERKIFFEYSDPMGYSPLREWIAKRLKGKVEEVMIVNGAQQALSILCQLFLSHQSKVLLESPTYPGLIPLLRYYNSEVYTIPIKQGGICLSTLKHYLSSPFKFLYLQPFQHNPTGITLKEDLKLEIVKNMPKHQVCVIEDSPLPLLEKGKTLYEIDPLKRVINIGSFSKLFIPGFRIGWICGPEELIKKTVYFKALQDLQTPFLLQILVYRFISSKNFTEYLRKMKDSLKSKARIVKDLAKVYFPNVNLNLRDLSYGIWFPLPKGFNSKEVEEKLSEKGFKVAEGDKFFYEKSQNPYIRIAHLNSTKEEIEKLFFELKKILHSIPLKKEYKITLVI